MKTAVGWLLVVLGALTALIAIRNLASYSGPGGAEHAGYIFGSIAVPALLLLAGVLILRKQRRERAVSSSAGPQGLAWWGEEGRSDGTGAPSGGSEPDRHAPAPGDGSPPHSR